MIGTVPERLLLSADETSLADSGADRSAVCAHLLRASGDLAGEPKHDDILALLGEHELEGMTDTSVATLIDAHQSDASNLRSPRAAAENQRLRW